MGGIEILRHDCIKTWVVIRELAMEGIAAAGFVFSVLGFVAFVRLVKLTKTLKEKGLSKRTTSMFGC